MLLAEESWNLTTMTTHKGLYRYLRLHMGIACSTGIFRVKVIEILEDIPRQINMTDDILVFGKTPEDSLTTKCEGNF